LLKAAKACVAVAGLSIALLGLLSGVLYFVLPLVYKKGGTDPLQISIVGTVFLVLGLGLGLPLGWQGLSSLLGRPSRPFLPRPKRRNSAVGLLLALFVLSVVVGQIILVTDFLTPLVFPPFYVLGAALPPLIVMAFVGRRLSAAAVPVRWREVVLQTGSGAFLAIFLALGLEATFGLFALFAVLFIVALTPNGMAWLQELTANLQDPSWIADPVNLSQVLFSSPIAIALLLIFVVIAPLGEELLKPLGVALMSYRRPGAARAFLWGVAGGAGFAIAEGLFNTAIALESWSAVVLSRAGSTLMHCLGSGLMGLGWYYLLRTRRPWHILGTYAASVGLHVLWNMGAIGMVAISLGAMAAGADEVSLTLSGLGVLVLGAYLILLTLFMAFAIYYLAGRAREEQWMDNGERRRESSKQ
jgi:hypothetical protein